MAFRRPNIEYKILGWKIGRRKNVRKLELKRHKMQ